MRHGPYAFVFFSSDQSEPVHVHVKRNGKIAKFWRRPVSIAQNRGFRRNELNKIRRLVSQYEKILVKSWHDYFDTRERPFGRGRRDS